MQKIDGVLRSQDENKYQKCLKLFGSLSDFPGTTRYHDELEELQDRRRDWLPQVHLGELQDLRQDEADGGGDPRHWQDLALGGSPPRVGQLQLQEEDLGALGQTDGQQKHQHEDWKVRSTNYLSIFPHVSS